MARFFRLRTILLVSAATALPLGSALGASVISLDTITVLATKLKEKAIEALAAVSSIGQQKIETTQPARLEQVFAGTPGLIMSTRVDDPGVGFNLRGLQDYGRVAVVVDGARQNFQVAQHGPEGKIYLDPELISGAEVARGPVTNIYGSGAIGGVVSLTTKSADDVLADGERFGAVFNGIAGSNQGPWLGSLFLAARPNENFDILFGTTARHLNDYADGSGKKIDNTWSDTVSFLAKARMRPSPGQEITLGAVHQHVVFDSGTPGDAAVLDDKGTDYGNTVDNSTLTAKYTAADPENPWVDLSAEVFWNRGSQSTVVKEQYCVLMGPPPCTSASGMDFTGPVGTTSGYRLDTLGYDIHNASRFAAFGLQNTLTLGTDLFADTVKSFGSNTLPDAGHLLTASGERQAYGGFAEWLIEAGSFLDIVGAVRYDGFHMASTSVESSGQRLSPKITVGLTPVEGFTIYGTYAEGYRAPSANEAFATGQHPGGIFQFMANPNLTPEVGHTLEAGINLARNGLFRPEDTFRFKGNIFTNDVTNYINLTDVSSSPDCTYLFFGFPSCYQYQNIASARIQGIELEGGYDAHTWFVNASGTLLDGKNTTNGERLASVLPAQGMLTVGARFFDERLTVAPNFQIFSGGSFIDDEGDTVTYNPYHLLGLNILWQATENATATLVFENILNATYRPYLQDRNAPGFTVKGGLKVKLAAQ